MNRSTRRAIRKLKDGDGNYLLNRDFNTAWGYTLLGKPVYTSDNMPEVEAGEKVIIYGDMAGLSVKLTKDVEIQVLQELYLHSTHSGLSAGLKLTEKLQTSRNSPY